METEINGKHVVFRDKFPARFGWGLLSAVARIDEKRIELGVDENNAGEAFYKAVLEVLTFEEITQFVRGAVESWEFDGDLKTDKACDNLNTVSELLPIAIKALTIFYLENLSGEADGPPIPASEA